jgi:hypothetical protein
MKKVIKSLAYALERDLRKDRFVFRKTAGAIISMVKNHNLSLEDLETLEKMLVEKDVFTEESVTEHQLNILFAEKVVNHVYATNLDMGFQLLEEIRNKKEARRPLYVNSVS